MTTKTKTPKTPKTPKDHKPKAGPRKVTVHGVTVTVDPAALNDFIVLDLLARLQIDDDPLAAPALFRRVLGDEDYRRVLAALADGETGRVDPAAAAQAFSDLMAEAAPNS